ISHVIRNAQSAVTYTSISSDSDGSSWGIPLMNAGELPEMDSYEEVAQQGQTHPLSPAYVPDPIELDEHMPVYVSKPEHSEYHAPSDDDIQVEDDDEDLEEVPSEEHEPEDDDEDHKEDPSEEYEPEDDDEDPEKDPNEEHEPEDEDTKEPSKGFDETEPRDDILEEDMPPRMRFVPTAPPPGCDVAESSAAVAARAPREQRMLVMLELCRLLSLLDARTDRRDIRLEIDVVRGQRTAYETKLQDVHQAYLSYEAQNRALLSRLETLETHMSHMEWKR
nr:hypothetical protein [Tanacetum cinerariifolium]